MSVTTHTTRLVIRTRRVTTQLVGSNVPVTKDTTAVEVFVTVSEISDNCIGTSVVR